MREFMKVAKDLEVIGINNGEKINIAEEDATDNQTEDHEAFSNDLRQETEEKVQKSRRHGNEGTFERWSL